MKVQQKQSLFDIAIQEDGSFLAAFEWAIENGLSVTDDLFPGQELKAPKSIYRNADVANYFSGKNQSISSGLNDMVAELIPDLGIGSMTIGTTFIVR